MANKNEQLAKDIYNWCKKKKLWEDCCIYFDGKAWASWNEWHEEYGKKINEDLYEFENRNPKEYFEYVNSETLSMSFEGPLYDVLNAYVPGWVKKEDEFRKLFEKYGFYYELGNAWNLSAYEI